MNLKKKIRDHPEIMVDAVREDSLVMMNQKKEVKQEITTDKEMNQITKIIKRDHREMVEINREVKKMKKKIDLKEVVEINREAKKMKKTIDLREVVEINKEVKKMMMKKTIDLREMVEVILQANLKRDLKEVVEARTRDLREIVAAVKIIKMMIIKKNKDLREMVAEIILEDKFKKTKRDLKEVVRAIKMMTIKNKDLREVVVTIREIKIKTMTRKSSLKEITTDLPEKERRLQISEVAIKMINHLKITTTTEEKFRMMTDVNDSLSESIMI